MKKTNKLDSSRVSRPLAIQVKAVIIVLLAVAEFAVFRIRIRTDPHKEMPLGSGSAWTDADPDPGGKKA